MLERIATILAPKDLGAAGTEVIDINLSEPISRITMIWKATVATVSVMTAQVLAAISKVELVDGSDVLFSLSAGQAQGLNYINRKVMPYNQLSLLNTEYQIAEFSIDFGRYLYDPLLALDPKKFTNPQLKITWDEDAANGSVVANSFAVYAHVFPEGKITPQGFLQSREFKSYAMAASTHEYIDLPVDLPIRLLAIQGDTTDHDAYALFDTIKIDRDNGKFIPLDIKADDYYRMLKAYYPRVVERIQGDDAVTAKTIYVPTSAENQVSIEYDDTAFVTAQSKFAVATYTGYKIALAASVDIKCEDIVVSGYLPYELIPIPFGDQQKPEEWYNLENKGSLRADILASSDADSGDTCRIITQQLRKY